MFEHSTAPQTLKKQTKVEDKTAKTNTSSGSLMTSLERLKAVALWRVFPELLADTHLRARVYNMGFLLSRSNQRLLYLSRPTCILL